MPTIVLVKDGHTDHSIHGFDEMGGIDDFSTDDLAYVLSTYKLIFYSNDRSEDIKRNTSRGGMNSMKLSNVRAGTYGAIEDDDF